MLHRLDDRELKSEDIFLDRDGDGIVDAIDLQIHLSPSCSNSKILSSLMDLSASLGFETMGMDLPFVETHQKRDPSFRHHLFIGLYKELQKLDPKENRSDYFLQGKDETDLAETIRKFTAAVISRKAKRDKEWTLKVERRRKEFDLLNPFSMPEMRL
jgi:hypothetical protein